MSYLVDPWLEKTSLANKATELSTVEFIIQTIAKASAITFGKSRNFCIMSVVFTDVNKSSLLGNTVSCNVDKYKFSIKTIYYPTDAQIYNS